MKRQKLALITAFALVLTRHFIHWHSMNLDDMLSYFQQSGTDIYFRNKRAL